MITSPLIGEVDFRALGTLDTGREWNNKVGVNWAERSVILCHSSNMPSYHEKHSVSYLTQSFTEYLQ